MKPWQQLLLDAANRIETYGWVNYNSSGVDGEACCAYQAIMRSSNDDMKVEFAAAAMLRIYIKENFLERSVTGSIVVWNDHKDTTKEEVLETLRAAAAIG